MFLWVRQRDGSYKLHDESVGKWIVRRNSTPPRMREINFLRVLEWRNGGNGVVLACDFTGDRRSPWHRLEIDLVRGKFGKYTTLPQNWKSII